MRKPEPLIFPLKLFFINSAHFGKWHYISIQFFKNVASTISSTPKVYFRSTHFSSLPAP